MPPSKNPSLNIKAVLQETGLAADTLRAWERRYGLPLPQRTAGGHRLYSQYDVEMIKWLMGRQSEGLSISRAVDAWNEQTTSGMDPLAGLTSSKSVTRIQSSPESSIESLRMQWQEACLEFNEAEAEHALNQAFAMYPVETVCTQVLQHGLSEIGSQWYENRASVQQEHFASALAMRRLDALLSATPPPTRNETILVGCPPNEWHTFTPLLITLMLRRRGMKVLYLGANVPHQQFEETAKTVHADLVILVAQQLITAATLMDIADALAKHNIPVGFGGRIFTLQPQVIARIYGQYLGDMLDSAVEQIESLVAVSAQIPKMEMNVNGNLGVCKAFQLSRLQIETTFHHAIQSTNLEQEIIDIATKFLGDNLIAALQLGEITLVDGEIDWVRNLLKANHVPESALAQFLSLYTRAVKQNMNDAGKPILTLLEKYH